MKNLKSPLTLIFIILLSANMVFAQQCINTSYSTNTVPITGTDNVAFGCGALPANTGTGSSAVGFNALNSNTGGGGNTGIGYQALKVNTSNNNTACGYQALAHYTSAGSPTSEAFGYQSLFNQTTGSSNVAMGVQTLFNDTTGSFNVAIGSGALFTNVTSFDNVAVGYQALYFSTNTSNSAVGFQANMNNSTGANNTSLGFRALRGNTTGYENTAIGYLAGTTFANDTSCTFLGDGADGSANGLNNSTALGQNATVNASNKVRIGSTTVTVIEGQVAYTTSDKRFKTNIVEDDVKGLEFIKKLRPVVYNFDTRKFDEFLMKNKPDSIKKKILSSTDYKTSTAIRRTGFLAQDVEEAAKEVGYNFSGVHVPVDANDNYSLAYGEFVVPLVKAVQQQQEIIETQNSTIQKQQTALTDAQNSIAAQAAQLQTIFTQLSNLQDCCYGSGKVQAINGATGSISPQLLTAIPNPASSSTTIVYYAPESANSVRIDIKDVTGNRVQTIPGATGYGNIKAETSKLASGMYYYSLIVDDKIIDTKPLVIASK